MEDRRWNIKDFFEQNISPHLRKIDDLAEQSHLKLCECIDIDEQKYTDEMANLDLTRIHIEAIKELLGYYR